MKAEKLSKETINQLGMRDLSFPDFVIGDHISVSVRIKEGEKERLQAFEGDVIARNNNGASTTFTVRKIGAHGVAIERIFPLYSPIIESIKFIRHGKSRRAKLYYVRNRVGKSAQLKEVKKSKVTVGYTPDVNVNQ
ncbi:MAG TPA: 50S ribosomal protein L19 [Candidatus Babeliales bacterium]|nr:50S ribosomal protein L19 [Candidatus Babeliales bacterium]